MIKISVVIACLNEVHTLGEQLDALSRQQWDDWEVIIADNGSTDGTQDLARSFADRLNIRVLDASDEPGAGYARNEGARAASGDALLFPDADDVVADGWLQHMGQALSKHDFVASKLEYQTLNPGWVYHSRGRPQEKNLARYPYGDFFPHGFGTSLGVKKSLHEAIGGFDVAFIRGQDMAYCWRIQEAGTPLVYVPEAVVHYRFRHDLGTIYHQARCYAQGNVLIYRSYLERHKTEDDVPVPPKPRLDLKKLAYLIVHYPRIRDKIERGSWTWHLGWELGIIAGAWRYRVLPF